MKILDNKIKGIQKPKPDVHLFWFSDNQRHLVCLPYSIINLHKMAADLGIKKCWFHGDHYDIPKRRINEIREKTIKVPPREILNIITTGQWHFNIEE